MVWPRSKDAVHDPVTGVPLDTLEKVGKASVKVPEGYVGIFAWKTKTGICKLTLGKLGNPFEAPTTCEESVAEYREGQGYRFRDCRGMCYV